MNRWQLSHLRAINAPQERIDEAFRQEVRWPQAFRVNKDARLLLLTLSRLLTAKCLTLGMLRESAIIACCCDGAMDSYERFDDALSRGIDMPTAFVSALPSIPLACASIYFQLTGLTYTMTGGPEVGEQAFEQAVLLLESEAADRIILLAWQSPSETAGNASAPARALSCILESSAVTVGSPVTRVDLPVTMTTRGDDLFCQLLAALEKAGKLPLIGELTDV